MLAASFFPSVASYLATYSVRRRCRRWTYARRGREEEQRHTAHSIDRSASNMAAASSAHLFGLGDAQTQMQPPLPQHQHQQAAAPPPPNSAAPAPKKKRNQPGNPSKYPCLIRYLDLLQFISSSLFFLFPASSDRSDELIYSPSI